MSEEKEVEIGCTSLDVGYDGHSVASNLTFSLCNGDYLCIIGENGAGKSTLMKTILGFIQPIKGSITYCPQVKKEGLGYLPQQTDFSKDFPSTAFEVVLSGFHHRCGWRPFYNKEDRKQARSIMEKLAISDLAKAPFSDLSGGQKQRVLLARALCSTQHVLLVDEPVAGLDPKAMEEMYSILSSLHEEGITIAMITHDVESALKYATHVLLINENSFFGTKEQYLDFIKKESEEQSNA